MKYINDMRRSCACLIFLSQCFIISLIVHYFPATLSFAFICLLTFLPFHLCFHGQFFLCFSVCEWMSFVRYVLGIQLDMECFACLCFFFFFFSFCVFRCSHAGKFRPVLDLFISFVSSQCLGRGKMK